MKETKIYKEITDNMKLLFKDAPTLKGKDIILKPLTGEDSAELDRLIHQDIVYRYLPTFLFELKYDACKVIDRLYDEGLNDSLILGVYRGGDFCGLSEIYGYRKSINKASVGYRLLKEKWGQGIATEALRIMVDELINVRHLDIITASTMLDNHASARVLEKNGFIRTASVPEDWGYNEPTIANKWFR